MSDIWFPVVGHRALQYVWCNGQLAAAVIWWSSDGCISHAPIHRVQRWPGELTPGWFKPSGHADAQPLLASKTGRVSSQRLSLRWKIRSPARELRHVHAWLRHMWQPSCRAKATNQTTLSVCRSEKQPTRLTAPLTDAAFLLSSAFASAWTTYLPSKSTPGCGCEVRIPGPRVLV